MAAERHEKDCTRITRQEPVISEIAATERN